MQSVSVLRKSQLNTLHHNIATKFNVLFFKKIAPISSNYCGSCMDNDGSILKSFIVAFKKIPTQALL